jgi:hypothetical protein|uniref:Uncharacterized protein n=1 Tax=Eutreptiella gymnastica TaxID=73025 RepID=A0A7S4CJ98_9EUGL|mmetsp:Transcript_29149/g.48518  ORF Transcript_29149/g.48518 Transcript_29149/m.48518 type:complete len:102 (+) Transcript_29149:313-618(+)
MLFDPVLYSILAYPIPDPQQLQTEKQHLESSTNPAERKLPLMSTHWRNMLHKNAPSPKTSQLHRCLTQKTPQTHEKKLANEITADMLLGCWGAGMPYRFKF